MREPSVITTYSPPGSSHGTIRLVAPNESTRTVLVALLAGLGVALAKVGAAVVTSSPALAAEASHSLADTANDLFFVIAQRQSERSRPGGDNVRPEPQGRIRRRCRVGCRRCFRSDWFRP
jgi:hypothetical protein